MSTTRSAGGPRLSAGASSSSRRAATTVHRSARMPGRGCAAPRAGRSIRCRPEVSGNVARSPGSAAGAIADVPLTREGLLVAVEELAARDADLAEIVARHGPPPLWDREPGFPTLLHIVLEQQVSLASARAAFDRLRVAADPLTPARFLELTDAELLAIGFSRQKARYGRALAEAIESGALDLDALAALDDEAVHRELQAI